MSAIATVSLIGVAAGVATSADASRKASHSAQDAAKASQVDINALDEQTRKIALKNAEDSRALEASLTPEVPRLRTDANNAVIGALGGDPALESAKQKLSASLGIPLNTPLLNDAIAKARSDLALGGKLSIDQQNLATRQGLAQAGTSTGNLGLGRDLAARDLGLTSYGVEQQRLMNASQLGGQELSLATDNSSNLLNQIQLLQSINSNKNAFSLGAAQYGQSIGQPIVGLDPSSVANIAIGNGNNAGAALSNRANIYGQQSSNYANLAGQLAGSYLNYSARQPTTTAPSYGTSGTGVHN